MWSSFGRKENTLGAARKTTLPTSRFGGGFLSVNLGHTWDPDGRFRLVTNWQSNLSLTRDVTGRFRGSLSAGLNSDLAGSGCRLDSGLIPARFRR